MSDLLLIGGWDRLSLVAGRLHAAGHAVMLAPEAGDGLKLNGERKFHLAIAEVASTALLAAIAEVVRRMGCPWIALDGDTLIAEAFAAGAVSVLPAGADTDLVERTASSLLMRLGAENETPRWRPGGQSRRRYRNGDTVLWSPGQVLLVEMGAVAQTALHADGTEVLLGFVPAGGLVVAPREDLFAPTLHACSESEVTALPWSEAIRLNRFVERLRDQLTLAEAWSAAQARPHLDDRLMGIFELLARQLGRPHPKGSLIDLRITHLQLAQAVGATRSTVTRLLARLRRGGRLSRAGDPGGERWIVHASSP